MRAICSASWLRISTSGCSTKTGSGSFDATVALKAGFLLGELRIFDFDAGDTYVNNVGTALRIEVYYDGVWTTAYDCKDTAEILTHRTKNASGTRYLAFDLSGYRAQMIRITSPSVVSGKSISIYEIECTGVMLPGSTLYSDNIIYGKNFELTPESTKHLNSAAGKVDVLTDGTLNVADSGSTVFYTWYNQADMQFDGTMRFSGNAILNTLRVYDYRANATNSSSFGPKVIIQVRNNGEWITLYDPTVEGSAKISL